MKNNVIEHAYEQTKHWLKRVHTFDTFCSLMERIVYQQKQGNFVKFNFGTSKDRYYFELQCNRYGLPDSLIDRSCDKLNASPLYKYDNKIKKLEETTKSIQEELKKWNTLLDNVFPETAPLNLVEEQVQIRSRGLILFMIENLKTKWRQVDKEKGLFKRYKNKVCNASELLLDQEVLFLEEAIKFFVKTIEVSMKQLFGTNRLYVKCSKKDLIKEYKTNYKRHNHRSETNLSTFEKDILTFIRTKVSDAIKVVLIKEKSEVHLHLSGPSFIEIAKNKEVHKPEIKNLEEQYQLFLKDNPTFSKLLKFRSFISQQLQNPPEFLMNHVNDMLGSYIPETVILRFNQFIQEFNELSPQEPRRSIHDGFRKVEDDELKQLLNGLTIESKLFKNHMHQWIPKEPEFEEKIFSISNQDWVWEKSE